ncbi:MAG: flagellar assembly protein FliH [Nitrosomonadales bacterium]|nr:flagellar assembly protein FliH [Nitrosomonadales bacterium]
MSNPSARKEQAIAFQRWELPSFDVIHDEPVYAEPEPEPELVLPTAADLEQIQRQAHEESFQLGHTEGYQAGYAEGIKAAAEEAQRLAQLLTSLNQELQQTDQAVAQELLDLSLGVARQMLHQALVVQPEIVLGVVRAAISTLPHFNQGAHLELHPDDAELVRKQLGEQLAHTGWKIFEDASIERGGCRVVTSNSEIDATLATRWQRVVASLGQDPSWMQA